MTTETNTAGKKGNTVWIPLFGYRKHKQTAGHLQRPTYCCEDYLKKKKKKSLSPWLPIYSPNWGLLWQHKQLSISLFQNTRYDSVSRTPQNLLPRSKSFQWWPAPIKREEEEKNWRWAIANVKQKTVTDHFTKFQLCLMSSIESAFCTTEVWTDVYWLVYLESLECVRAQIKYQGARTKNFLLRGFLVCFFFFYY